MLGRIEPGLDGFDRLLAQLAARQMHTGELARIVGERDHRVLVGDVAQVDADVGLTAQKLAQLRDRKAVARVNANHRGPLRQDVTEIRLQLLRQILQLRSQARVQALAGPDELLTELRQTGAPSTRSLDERSAEETGPFLDQVPAVPVGNLSALSRARDFAGFPQLTQDLEHHEHRATVVFPTKSPNGLDFNAHGGGASYMHGSAY